MLSKFCIKLSCFILLFVSIALLVPITMIKLITTHREESDHDHPTNATTTQRNFFQSTVLELFETWTPTIEIREDCDVTESAPLYNESLPWYKENGTRYPNPAKVGPCGRRVTKLWPGEDRDTDRIESQLMFFPPDPAVLTKNKTILLYHGLRPGWGNTPKWQREVFTKCPVNTCTLSTNQEDAKNADAIIFQDHVKLPGVERPPRQVWILYLYESPVHTQYPEYGALVNWTATYRRDSDVVHPYGKWMYHDPAVTEYPGPLRDFTANKTDKVAWFVTNRQAKNGRRQYALELQQFIQVDIYGPYEKLKCPLSKSDECFELLDRKYKFYLAFENSNCKEYITEKLFVNSLGRNILPIVMGARPQDYARVAPKHSFIHVDEFESPKKLAEYLHKLDQDNDLYNSYFKWKGTGEIMTNSFQFCRFCALLYDDFPVKSYRDIRQWWSGDGLSMCTAQSWRKLETDASYD